MSAEAGRQRDERRRWAAPGGRHDRLISAARIALPAAIGVLAALLAVAPLTAGRDVSFVLAKDRVEVAQERMRVSEAVYRGEDRKGQPFQLRAASAVQATSTDPVVKLSDLSARIMLSDGPANLVAPTSRYDMNTEMVDVNGPVRFTRADGSVIQTRDVTVNLDSRQLKSAAPVDGVIPLGRFSSNRFSGDLEARTLNLDGNVRLHITQRRGRAAR
ncbi:LPS export ABC transporter periplasmic protein LptC [Sphingomonas quercus]|uniref:LPS export ABC transporter periplasmic protein LptC n=1 Tax=Sphingomonas quercus TaxID=2842451 RepID=A0ABS6BI81_9SPHN|nr:LPS export ABC transporter periplasmic protein LptC [Sphingomonas quercus]MBU3078017.1 LPS export ABC transporter periplasmic protein LptC [Sphingomonas quercus]